ncbi:MFS transporter [Nesterenkonia sp. MY13]|uniref:MFS transporter n=1 Tax=Nesterenkonia sedimenti TaxID=1463632 RepID=A0A7X8TLV6_9MICC|nr:MFS transporter [Nesterenkonia sedimenti]NLS10772.1 MFS transporter [Nesterenkonia sedimenti]
MSLGRSFKVLWGANALSNLSDGITFVSMPLLAASLTDDPRWVAGLATLYAVVRLTVVLPIGVYVDRLDRRTLLVLANLLRGAALVCLALTIHFGPATLMVLYGVMAIVAALESVADSSAIALLPSLVKKDHLDGANSRIAATQLAADEFIGPPLGGLLFTAGMVLPAYVMGGLWAAAGAFALALPKRSRPTQLAPPEQRPSVYREALEGAQWLLKNRTVMTLALIGGLSSIGYMLPFSVLVLFADIQLDLNAAGYGILLAFSALGGLAGSFITVPIRIRLGYRWTITSSLILGASTLALLAYTTQVVLAALLLALYIMHAVVWNICSTSIRQRLVPSELLGRVGATSKVLGLLGLALGSALGGLLATTDIALPTLVGSIIFCGCVLLAFFLPRDPESQVSR